MKSFRICRCLAGLALWYASGAAATDTEFDTRFNSLQEGWQHAYYVAPEGERADRLEVLLGRAEQLRRDYPLRPEAYITEAIVLCVYSGENWGLSALSNVAKARDLLLQAKDMDPKTMEGSAFITLGALYYQVPGWPFSFGDDDVAEMYLKKAVQLFPNALDSNYFYGDYLYHQDKYKKAYKYLKRADQAPVRPQMALSDRQLKKDLAELLAKVKAKLEP